jgi:phosphatidylserine decarboxylase
MHTPRVPLASEGYPFILFSAFATLAFSLLDLVVPALGALLLTAFVTYFFRDPARVLPEEKDAIVSPADGKVIVVREMDDDCFLHERVHKISIFMNVFNVHVNRIPLAGTVERVVLTPGRIYAADKDKAVLHNERCALTVATPAGVRYAVVQIAGLIARRIVCRAEPGDRVTVGQRYGMIRFGSRLDLYLPLATEIRVREGELVRAGESVLGLLRESASDKA